MHIYTNFMGNEVDLDDSKLLDALSSLRTYKPYSEMSRQELYFEVERELGYALLYMDYYFPGFDEKQKTRVENLIGEFITNKGNTDKQYWRSLLFRVIDEIENMC